MLVNTVDTITVNIMGLSLEQHENRWNTSAHGRSVIYDLVYAAMSGSEMTERLRAVGMLGQSNDPRAVRPLMDLLLDPDAGIRLNATIALGLLRSGRPVDDLIDRLRDRAEQEDIRQQAALTLAAIRSTGAIHGLREFASDSTEDAGLRASAASLLREMGAWEQERPVP